MSHQSQVPPVAAAYLRNIGAGANHPTIAQVFKPGRGWVRYSGRKFISASWAQKLRASEGVTHLALRVGPDRVADFSVAELLRRESWPVA
jgi:hypothetical protein